MKVTRSAAEILSQHTTLTLECIDRLYLNVYVPVLQRAAGAAYFFRKVRGASVPSSALMAPITQRFVEAIKRYAERNGHRYRVGGCPADSRRSVTTGPSRYPTFCNSARASSSSRCAFSIHRCW